MTSHVVALCGGVGGAKLAHGLAMALPAESLTVIVNTADDFEHLGLHISPDLDSVMYALAGLSDPDRGWGQRAESWNFMEMLQQLGGPGWFRLGDRDLAVHIERSRRLSEGVRLSEVTAQLCSRLGITVRVLPMSDEPVRTRVLTDEGWLEFQEYFVHRHCEPPVQAFAFAGAEAAHAVPEAARALARSDLTAIVICPSNPFVSVEPILAVSDIRLALERARAPVIAVTPIVGGKALKGPAAKMLGELGLEVTPEAVARRYTGIIDAFVVDAADPLPAPIRGITFFSAATIMRSEPDRLRLAQAVLRSAAELVAREP
ncbi:MAG TPA: 2-phospho-L-lactate transferase [Steroidobacteraceae bacterium]|nr:2-phospho-L-lactate transferase [Steroidobacteraceae bacterium]